MDSDQVFDHRKFDYGTLQGGTTPTKTPRYDELMSNEVNRNDLAAWQSTVHALETELAAAHASLAFQSAQVDSASRSELRSNEPQWIVNDNGELGVTVGGRFFFLYKGDSIEYDSEDVKNEDGTPMMYRIVGKREFGETCQPLEQFRKRWPGRYMEPLIYTPGLSFGQPSDGEWRELPAPDKRLNTAEMEKSDG